jgi:hypothetical protein
MKKLLVLILIGFMLCGCSTPKTEEPENTTEIVVTPTEKVEDEGALKANTTVRTLTFGGKPDRSNAPKEITRENNEFLQLIDFVESVLYGDVPEDAEYPAVKYLPGEWIYCICGDETNFGLKFYDLGFADFDYSNDGDVISITLHPRLYWEADELYPEDDGETGGVTFSGTRVAKDSYYSLADVNSNILCVYCYYKYENLEYVMAEFWTSEETYADVLFYRTVQQ